MANCVWCGLALSYANPPPPGNTDADVDLPTFYQRVPRPWHDLTLIDPTGSQHCKGAGAKSEQAYAVGQYPHHQLPPVING